MRILSKGLLKQKQSESWKHSYSNPLFLVNFCWYPLLKQYDIFGEQTFDTEPTDKMKYLNNTNRTFSFGNKSYL